MKILTKIQQELLKLHNLGAPWVIEGAESIFATKIAISTTKIIIALYDSIVHMESRMVELEALGETTLENIDLLCVFQL